MIWIYLFLCVTNILIVVIKEELDKRLAYALLFLAGYWFAMFINQL